MYFHFQIKQGVHLAFRTILEKRVVQSLSPILDNPKLDQELTGLIRTNLQEFCAPALSDGNYQNISLILLQTVKLEFA